MRSHSPDPLVASESKSENNAKMDEGTVHTVIAFRKDFSVIMCTLRGHKVKVHNVYSAAHLLVSISIPTYVH